MLSLLNVGMSRLQFDLNLTIVLIYKTLDILNDVYLIYRIEISGAVRTFFSKQFVYSLVELH